MSTHTHAQLTTKEKTKYKVKEICALIRGQSARTRVHRAHTSRTYTSRHAHQQTKRKHGNTTHTVRVGVRVRVRVRVSVSVSVRVRVSVSVRVRVRVRVWSRRSHRLGASRS